MKDVNYENKLRAQVEADNTIRASLKRKMLAAGPDQFVEADFAEMIWLSNRENMNGLIQEIEAEKSQRDKQEVGGMLYGANRAGEAGLAAMAGCNTAKEPDHATHLLKQVDAARPSFEEVVAPLMKYLADHYHPHVTVIVTSTTAEMVEGLKSFNTNEFIKD